MKNNPGPTQAKTTTLSEQSKLHSNTEDSVNTVKTLLSESKYRIQLDDLVTDQARRMLKE